MYFFLHRTVIEWSGWLDEYIWSSIAMMMSVSEPALRHALISLALYHEHLEMQDAEKANRLWQLSFTQAQRALNLLLRDQHKMPPSVVMTIHFAVTAFTALFDNETGYQALQAQYALLDQPFLSSHDRTSTAITSNEGDLAHHLAFVLQRRRDRHGRVTDMLWSLIHAPLHNLTSEFVVVPDIFVSLRQARQVLESLLNNTTHEVKLRIDLDHTLPLQAKTCLNSWLQTMHTFISAETISEEEINSAKILIICAKLGFMLIEMIDKTDEMAFDRYTRLFDELADVFEQNTVYRRRKSRANVSFILDSGLLCYVGHAAMRWCRDPPVRQRLINALFSSQRQEGIEPAQTWGALARYIKMIEESGLIPPPLTCSDIPAVQRVRIVSTDYFWKSQLVRVKYIQPPWREDRIHDIWLCYDGQEFCRSSGIALGQPPSKHNCDDRPDLHYSRGKVAWKVKNSHQYYNLETLDFHFPLPRM